MGIAAAQQSDYPMMEKIADKLVQKYRTTSCNDLAAQKSQPPTGKQAQMEKAGGRYAPSGPEDARRVPSARSGLDHHALAEGEYVGLAEASMVRNRIRIQACMQNRRRPIIIG
jgi:hypothetical protein